MSIKNTIISTLGADAKQTEDQYQKDIGAYHIPRERFAEAAKAMKTAGARLVAEWATDETRYPLHPLPDGERQGSHCCEALQWEAVRGRGFGIYACYEKNGEYLIVKTYAPVEDPSFPSLTKKFIPAYRFERQMKSLMGVIPAGHHDSRPWIKHEDWQEDVYPLRKSFDASKAIPRIKGEYQWIKAEGEGVYEIPVGPVHAGIIEPGHFRFQAVGEDVINLEEKLGYVHKGIEKRFESLSWKDGARLAGRVSGDTTVAHSLAYCRAVESMTGCGPPERALWLRALFLERERIANHLGDIGAIANDAAFTFMLYQLTRLKESLLRTNYKLFAHRFMMDRVIPGGVSVDITQEGKDEILSEMSSLSEEFERLAVIYEENPSLDDRLRNTGVLTPDRAKDLCVVGFTARASGQEMDCRIRSPFPPYDRIIPKMTVLNSGDVHARGWVRVEEIRDSIRIIREILNSLPEGELTTSPPFSKGGQGGVTLQPDKAGFAVVEGWRGEIVYWIQSGQMGGDKPPHLFLQESNYPKRALSTTEIGVGVNRCMVRDPSSVNWIALEEAIHGNIIPDFPLCNKSFNQSYSGNDL
ncbi:MAG: NADH-quinone oxidoreductase subunit C [Nitrospinae bacterium]|nr:NADH-quinone oxidoreductase subunit C [Nitrospinota bacterium]